MKLWFTSFILLFGAAEFFQWMQQVSLPMPIFVLGGAFLAIASNYDKLVNLPFHLEYKAPDPLPKEAESNQAMPPAKKLTTRPTSVSFEIQKPFKPGD
jgi:hypothetical protein